MEAQRLQSSRLRGYKAYRGYKATSSKATEATRLLVYKLANICFIAWWPTRGRRIIFVDISVVIVIGVIVVCVVFVWFVFAHAF